MATNFWTRFQRLLPDSPVETATVVTVSPATGFSTVKTSAGGVMRVKGTGVAVGLMCFIRDGAIIGQAPSLPHYELEI